MNQDSSSPTRVLRVASTWKDVLAPASEAALSAALSEFVRARRWFRGKDRQVRGARVIDQVPLAARGEEAHILLLLAMDYERGEPDVYAVALGFAPGAHGRDVAARLPHALVARIELEADAPGATDAGCLFDVFASGDAAYPLLEAMAAGREFPGLRGRIRGEGAPDLQALCAQRPRPNVDAGTREQSNTVVAIGQSALLKAYRQLEPGVNCEIEIGRHLSLNPTSSVPRLLGSLHYHQADQPPAVLASVQAFVANQGDAWTLMLQSLDAFLQWVEGEHPRLPQQSPPASLVARSRCAPEAVLQQRCAIDLERLRLLGRRTAEMHIALGTPSADPAFEREPFSSEYQSAVYDAASARLTRLIDASQNTTHGRASAETQTALAALLDQASTLDAILLQVRGPDFAVERIRCHGDFHLGQVLFTGDDFVIIDFEGEPARPLSERRLKQCVLRDVTGMIRSLSYAGDMACRERRRSAHADATRLEPWAQAWTTWMAAAYLGAYLDRLGSSPLVPGQDMLIDALLDFYELDKALYEVEYELGSRPDWIDIPLLGIGRIVERWRNRAGVDVNAPHQH